MIEIKIRKRRVGRGTQPVPFYLYGMVGFRFAPTH